MGNSGDIKENKYWSIIQISLRRRFLEVFVKYLIDRLLTWRAYSALVIVGKSLRS